MRQKYKKRFSENLTIIVEVEAPLVEGMQPTVNANVIGRMVPKHLPAYIEWMERIYQECADHWQQTIAVMLPTGSKHTMLVEVFKPCPDTARN
ncbi:hypothetical protein [Haloferula sp. A504]|uniref:hypothetical protein n=1 Tax=Haloferula sp. A504 TaxID=3373601 RepID=UPI0031C6DCB3|nr:hypothetical protein [Verrucomicrobiaceae bacterium E54]